MLSRGKEKKGHMNRNKRNPYWKSYVCLALICCLLLIAVFSYINFTSTRKTERHYNQAKAELIVDDFESQMELLNNLALNICIDTRFQPFYYMRNKYNEKVMLEDFEQYATRTIIAREAFLYYGGANIFHSTGYTIRLTTYLQDMDALERNALLEALCDPADEIRMLPLGDNIYAVFPLHSVEAETPEQEMAVLCFVIAGETMEKRFQIVTGGAEGTISLYKDNDLIFCSGDTPCSVGEKKVLTAVTPDRAYTLCYRPNAQSLYRNDMILLQLALTCIAVLCLFAVATLFANASYHPLEALVQKYQQKIQPFSREQTDDIVLEIDSLLDSSVQSNMNAKRQLARDKSLIYQQCLQMLLDGKCSLDMYTYLKELHINISGPYYYVVNLSFGENAFEAGAAKQEFIRRLNGLAGSEDGCYIYALHNRNGREQLVSVICSIQEQEQKEQLNQMIWKAAKESEAFLGYGVGNTYNTLSQLHASWLEGMDNLYISTIQKQPSSAQKEFTYDAQALDMLVGALSSGDEAQAEEWFSTWIEQMEGRRVSILMQRYMFSEFMSEISRLARRFHITLSNQNVSLLVAADDLEHFKTAALQVIYEFISSLRQLREQLETEQNRVINSYIQEHFTEYDLSIEKTAFDLSVSTTTVRKAVLQQTGRMYKEQIIYLRIEYAKELLMQDYSVSEVCRMVGYGNDSYFIKTFKKMTGVTPSAYRKMQINRC